MYLQFHSVKEPSKNHDIWVRVLFGSLWGSVRLGRVHSSSERSERFVRFEPNVHSERVRYFSERETNVQALKRLINLIAVK